MRQVFSDSDNGNAHAIRIMLNSHDVAALVQERNPYGKMQPPPSVWVADVDYETAVNLVREFDIHRTCLDVTGKIWECPGCGEKIEELFSQCWNCGTGREVAGSENA